MTMPKSPRIIGNLFESAMGRRAQVLEVHQPAPGFLQIELTAEAPPGGWHPGHEIQFRVAPTLGRRYTVRTTSATTIDQIGILAATEASGPGSTWLQGLRAGQDITLLAGRHRPIPPVGINRLYLGDSCSIGTFDAYTQGDPAPIVVAEVSETALTTLTPRRPQYRFVPRAKSPGDGLQVWLEDALRTGELAHLDGALLLGHARSIQRQRNALVESETMTRRAISTRPYWADGKKGL
jgi:NADPH-dependent ferric siderophore reductase